MKPHFPCFISGRLGAVLLSSACGVFLMAGKAKGIEFVLDNTVISTFSGASAQSDPLQITVTNSLQYDDGSVIPTGSVADSTSGANPWLIVKGPAGVLDTFIIPNDDLTGGGGKIWELNFKYSGLQGLSSIHELNLNMGLAHTTTGEWYDGTKAVEPFQGNILVTANIYDTADLTDAIGTLTGYVWQDGETHNGFGANLKPILLDDGTAQEISLEGIQEFQITFTAQYQGGKEKSVKLALGLGGINFQGQTTSLGYIWDGSEGLNQWSDSVWDTTQVKNRAFASGGPAVFNGSGVSQVNINNPVQARHVYVEPEGVPSCEYTFNLAADSEGVPSLYTEILTVQNGGRLNLTNEGTVHAGSMAGNGTLGKVGSGTSILIIDSDYDQQEGEKNFTGNIVVEEGLLDIQSQVDLSLQDVTLGSQLHVGTEEGYKNVTVNGTLTAQNVSAGLNANLVMADGSTLDVSATGGTGGLLSDGTVTFNLGNIILSEDDMEMISALEFHGMYDLFHGVESFTVGSDTIEPGTWVKASDVFSNELFKGDKEYYLFYSGNSEGGQGGNVGTIYLMQIPEPATGTLSLLALAGLAARRRRKY